MFTLSVAYDPVLKDEASRRRTGEVGKRDEGILSRDLLNCDIASLSRKPSHLSAGRRPVVPGAGYRVGRRAPSNSHRGDWHRGATSARALEAILDTAGPGRSPEVTVL